MKCIFVGYPENSKGYKLYDPAKRAMFRSRDVEFDEYKTYDDFKSGEEEPDELLPSNWVEAVLEQDGDPKDESNASNENNKEENVDGDNPDENEELIEEDPRRPHRNRNAPDWFGERIPEEYASIAACDDDEPQSIEDAMEGKDSVHWKNACDDEIESLVKNGTWELVNLPIGKTTIGCKWVMKKKRGADGNVNRYKSRVVAQGFTQRKGIDYQEVFSPVVRYSSIRMVLAVANQFDMEVHQMDVMSAYLNGILEEEIYMKQPP